MSGIGRRLYETNFGAATLATEDDVRELIDKASAEVGEHRFSTHFLWTEWSQVVDAWQLESWEDYRDVMRLGRKTPPCGIPARVCPGRSSHRCATPWPSGSCSPSLACSAIWSGTSRRGTHSPFEFCVIDEAQDVGRGGATLSGGAWRQPPPTACSSPAISAQRIFRAPFSWRALGVDVRGRSHTLRINYRTSHQIRRQADRLLPPELADVDGITERRGGTVSAFNGPQPEVRVFASPDEEAAAITDWLTARRQEGFAPHEIAVFVRSEDEIARAREAVRLADLTSTELDERSEGVSDRVVVGTMHLAKGLEFRAVAVVACDDEVLPLQSRIENVADEADLEDTYSTERHLLYVACTRARDHLLVTGVEPASEFLDDLQMDE